MFHVNRFCTQETNQGDLLVYAQYVTKLDGDLAKNDRSTFLFENRNGSMEPTDLGDMPFSLTESCG